MNSTLNDISGLVCSKGFVAVGKGLFSKSCEMTSKSQVYPRSVLSPINFRSGVGDNSRPGGFWGKERHRETLSVFKECRVKNKR